MLKLLRHKGTQKKIYIFLALAVVLTFAVSGVIIGGIGDKTPSSVGKIDGKKIPLQEYLASYKAVDHQAAWTYGDRYKQLRRAINFQSEAWDRLLLLYHAKKENIRVSDKDVVDWLTSQSGFSNKGVFDTAFYKRYVKEALHMDARQFEEEIRQMLAIRKISEGLRSQTKFTDEELKTLYAKENAEHDISYGIVSWETEKTGVPTPDDKELESFYPTVQYDLMEPERLKMKYLQIPQEREEELKEAFTAGKIETIESLSKKYNLPVHETGFVSREDREIAEQIPPSIIGFCFSMPEGKETGWLKIDKGAFKFLIEEKKPAQALGFQEAKAKVKELWIKTRASEAAVKKLNGLRQKSGTDLDALLKNAGVAQVKKLEKFKKGGQLPDPKSSQAFEKALESLKPGEISGAFVVSDGAAILRLDKVSASDEKKFAEEKESFKNRLTDEKVEAAFTALLERLRAKLTVDLETMKKIFAES